MIAKEVIKAIKTLATEDCRKTKLLLWKKVTLMKVILILLS